MSSAANADSPWLLYAAFAFVAFMFTILNKNTKKCPKNDEQIRQLPPGPSPWPLIGSIYAMMKHRPTFKWIHGVMRDLDTEIACFRFGSVHVISISNDEIALEALRTKDAVFASRPESFAAMTFCNNYKTCIFPASYCDRWMKTKKLFVSELNSKKTLDALHDKRVVEADNLLTYVNRLYQKSNTVNVREITQHFCHSLSLRMSFGKRYLQEATADGGPGAADINHTNAIFTCLEYLYAFCISDYFPCLKGFDLDGHEKYVKQANKTLADYEEPIVEERIELWKKMEGKKEVDDWLDMLISLKQDDGTPLLTPMEIKAEIKEIMIAAIDNPSNNVEWVLAEMLNHPDILAKAVEELDEIVGKDRLVQESDIPKLNYIKSCCREGYRMHPIAPFLIPHVARDHSTLAGYFIPKGSHILISRILLGRNPKIWKEPNRFWPERHLGNGSAEVILAEPDMKFVSFSTGRRGCPGVKIGSNINVMLIARLLQGFTWSSPNGPVDLREAANNLFMAKPLVARVEPRLAPHMYPQVFA